VLRETTSRGLCGLVCPSRTSERGGEGDCVKERGGSPKFWRRKKKTWRLSGTLYLCFAVSGLATGQRGWHTAYGAERLRPRKSVAPERSSRVSSPGFWLLPWCRGSPQ
jgi:hypothetical protein